jgi:hypothetical protein
MAAEMARNVNRRAALALRQPANNHDAAVICMVMRQISQVIGTDARSSFAENPGGLA